MKRRLLWFILFLLFYAWFGRDGLHAQNVQIQPDCLFFANYTVTTNVITNVNGTATSASRFPSAGFNNGTTGCVSWTVVYYVTGVSALSLEIDEAPDNAGIPGTWATFANTNCSPGAVAAPCIVAGINPNTAITSASTTVTGYFKWVSVNLTGLTGTGHVNAFMYGCRSITCASLVLQAASGSTGSVSISGPLGAHALTGSVAVSLPSDQIANPMCGSLATANLSGSGLTQVIAASGSTTVRICHLSLSTVASEDIKVSQGTGSNCATPGTPADLTGLYKSVTALAFDFGPFSPLTGSASQAICISQSIAQATGVTIIYDQR